MTSLHPCIPPGFPPSQSSLTLFVLGFLDLAFESKDKEAHQYEVTILSDKVNALTRKIRRRKKKIGILMSGLSDKDQITLLGLL
jgi:hypothetical protein